MKHCKDCGHWRQRSECNIGRCNRLTLEHNLLKPAIGCQRIIDTPYEFGCNEFKEKPKGPFTAEKRRGSICEVWDVDVHFPGHDSHWLSKGTQKQATELARFLNERWAERRE